MIQCTVSWNPYFVVLRRVPISTGHPSGLRPQTRTSSPPLLSVRVVCLPTSDIFPCIIVPLSSVTSEIWPLSLKPQPSILNPVDKVSFRSSMIIYLGFKKQIAIEDQQEGSAGKSIFHTSSTKWVWPLEPNENLTWWLTSVILALLSWDESGNKRVVWKFLGQLTWNTEWQKQTDPASLR